MHHTNLWINRQGLLRFWHHQGIARTAVDTKRSFTIVRRKSLGVLAAGMLAALGTAVAAGPAQAKPLPFPPGANFQPIAGYLLHASIVPNNIVCTDTVANKWSVEWLFTIHTSAPDITATVTAASAGGLGVLGTKSQPPNYPPSGFRDLVWSGSADYTGTVDLKQTITYSTFVKTAQVPAGVSGEDTTAEVTIHSPCSKTLPLIPGASRFVSLTPDRMLDTRNGNKVDPDGTITVPMLGRNGIPGSNVKAVVLNVTATQATAAGFVTVYPTGAARPSASNLNLDRAGQTTPNLVTVPVGGDGSVSIYTSGGSHILVDVMGYYESTNQSVRAGRFLPLAPSRVIDTRGAPVGAGGILSVPLAGHNGVPASGADAVVLNVTATGALRGGFVTVFPAGQGVPVSSNLNIDHAGETRANQVIVKLGAGGAVNLFTDGGTDLIVDVSGYFTSETSGLSRTGLFVPVTPGRAFDTRDPSVSASKPAPGASFLVQMTGYAGLPSGDVSAVALNVTAVDATNPDFVTVWPEGTLVTQDKNSSTPSGLPVVSSLNLDAVGQTVPNHVTSLVGSTGQVSIFTHGGAHLLIDILGWYTNGLVMAA